MREAVWLDLCFCARPQASVVDMRSSPVATLWVLAGCGCLLEFERCRQSLSLANAAGLVL